MDELTKNNTTTSEKKAAVKRLNFFRDQQEAAQQGDVTEDLILQKIVQTRISIHQSDDTEEQVLRRKGEGLVKQKSSAAASLPPNDTAELRLQGQVKEDPKNANAHTPNPGPLRLHRNTNISCSGPDSFPGAYHVVHPDATSVDNYTDDDNDNDVSSREDHDQDAAGATGLALSVPLDATLVQDNSNNGNASRTDASHPDNACATTTNNETISSGGGSSSSIMAIEGKPVVEGRLSTLANIFHLGGIFCLLITVIVLLSLGVSGVFQKEQDPTLEAAMPHNESTVTTAATADAANPPLSTLELIRAEGILRCGYRHLPVANGNIEGFLGVLCGAVAAAIFGTNSANITQTLPGTNLTITQTVPMEFVEDTKGSIFDTLVQKKIHLKTFGYTHNMERNVFREEVQSGFQFSIPYLYEGMRIAGDPFFVRCAENNLKHIDECEEMRICLGNHSTYHTRLQQLLPRRNIAVMPRIGMINHGLVNGDCNLLAGSSFLMATNETIREAGYTGEYLVSDSFFTKEPVAIATRPDDPEWSDFVNAVVVALFAAEQKGITQDMSSLMPQVEVFGDDYKDMFRNAVGYAGNFGEIYLRLLQDGVPRGTLNWINEGSSGLMYSYPLGAYETDRGDAPLGDHLTKILESGELYCGIRTNRPGFAATIDTTTNTSSIMGVIYGGMEVDYCYALSASLFGGSTTNVVFVELEDQEDGFRKLAAKEIDVFAGATWTLENDVKQASTGQGFTFTKSYFYGAGPQEDNLALATRQDDHDWSTFVLWTVMATIYAEEEGIDALRSNDMPEVLLYGSGLKRMLRDTIYSVGNYGDIYARNLQDVIPRGGRNLLNKNPDLGPQHYVPPGFI